jgi:glycerol-3-phosphate acyltransferase PlsY
MQVIVLFIMAYLIGSIPTSVWVSRYFFNIDIRDFGSGNAGATNTFRVLGVKAGSFVFLFDFLKGFVAVDLAYLIMAGEMSNTALTNLQIGLGIVAVLGHIFPIWANFRGGKGIATLFGMILAIHPTVALCLVGVFVVMLFTTRYVSLSSIAASVAFPILLLFIFREPVMLYKVFAISAAVLVVLSHHKNIGRLVAGNENRVPMFGKGK